MPVRARLPCWQASGYQNCLQSWSSRLLAMLRLDRSNEFECGTGNEEAPLTSPRVTSRRTARFSPVFRASPRTHPADRRRSAECPFFMASVLMASVRSRPRGMLRAASNAANARRLPSHAWARRTYVSRSRIVCPVLDTGTRTSARRRCASASASPNPDTARRRRRRRHRWRSRPHGRVGR